MQHGTRWVYDTDDDNELKNAKGGIPLPRMNALVTCVHRGDIERWSPHAYTVEPLRETHRMLSTYHELALTSV